MDPEPALPDSCLSMFSEELMSKAWGPDSTLDLLLLAEAQGLPFPLQCGLGWVVTLPVLDLHRWAGKAAGGAGAHCRAVQR